MAYGAILGQSNLQPNNFWSLDSTGTIIPDGSDLNDFINPGNYNNFGIMSPSILNCPIDTTIILKVYQLAAAGIGQWLQTYDGGATYWRYRSSGGVWTDWKQFAFLSDFENGYYSLSRGTLIQSNTDLNTLTAYGNYYCSASSIVSTLSNCPVTSAFTLKVYAGTGTSYPCQLLTHYNNGSKFFRYYNSTSRTWSDWQQYVGFYQYSTSDLQAGTSPLATGSLYLVYE